MSPNAAEKHISRNKRIAVCYHIFMGGGAETVGLWMLEALKEKYHVTLYTVADVNLEQLNSMYGTSLTRDCIKVESLIPASLAQISNFFIANNGSLKRFFIHLLIRHFKACQADYDLAISAYNAMDLGRKGIQYIHWVKVIESSNFYHWISQFSEGNMRNNISIANSDLVAETVKKTYGKEPIVVYPPVVIDISEIPWEHKENAFICSGRLTETKQPHKAIRILKQVREKGFDVKLYITGGGGGMYAERYKRFLKKMVEENSDWVMLYENLKYKDYVKVLAKCRYGIHYKKEPFGISIAEMLKAGAIPFVRSQGGQTEIVGEENQELFFDGEEEAVKKIVDVLSNPSKQENLLAILDKRKYLFSTDKFKKDIVGVVEDYFFQHEESNAVS